MADHSGFDNRDAESDPRYTYPNPRSGRPDSQANDADPRAGYTDPRFGYGDEWRRRRRGRRLCGPSSAGARLSGAFVLIAAGLLLFLDNIGVLRIYDIWRYWPVILIAIGVGRLFDSRFAAQRTRAVFLIVFGALFLLVTLHVVFVRGWSGAWPLGLLLVALGLSQLVAASESSYLLRRRVSAAAQGVMDEGAGEYGFLNERCFMGSVKRRMESENFSGGSANAVLGSIDIDLRRALIATPERQVQVDVYTFCGSVKFKVPETWTVTLRTMAVLGNVEDKTIPARPIAGMQPPNLIITGEAMLGSVEVEN